MTRHAGCSEVKASTEEGSDARTVRSSAGPVGAVTTTPPIEPPTIVRILYVVARDRPQLYAELREKFVESSRLAIVLDRRSASGPPDPRRDERRRLVVDESLRTRGWARVRIETDGSADTT
jgi:hypothetical protein